MRENFANFREKPRTGAALKIKTFPGSFKRAQKQADWIDSHASIMIFSISKVHCLRHFEDYEELQKSTYIMQN